MRYVYMRSLKLTTTKEQPLEMEYSTSRLSYSSEIIEGAKVYSLSNPEGNTTRMSVYEFQNLTNPDGTPITTLYAIDDEGIRIIINKVMRLKKEAESDFTDSLLRNTILKIVQLDIETLQGLINQIIDYEMGL